MKARIRRAMYALGYRRESKFEGGQLYRRRSWVIATRWSAVEEENP